MLNKIFLLLNLFFLSNYFLVAQSVEQPGNVSKTAINIRITIADTSNNSLLLKQDNLKEIWGVFKENELQEIRLRYKEPGSEFWNSEYFDMNFEGDRYVFKKKYENSIHFIAPKINARQIYGEKLDELNSEWLRTVIRQDSIGFDFSLLGDSASIKNEMSRGIGLGMPAKYAGDLKNVCLAIEKRLSKIDFTVGIDSIIVFRGVIGVSGDMSSLTLEAGEHSAFSDAVKDVLNHPQETRTLRERKFWVPARIERGTIKSNIRIYAKLNKNGSVTVSTTRLLGTQSVLE